MKAVATEAEVYLWLGATDMRAGFERLAAFVQERMSRRVLAGGLYVFVSRCRRRVKILHWGVLRKAVKEMAEGPPKSVVQGLASNH